MQSIDLKEFNSIDKTRLSYFTFGKTPKPYSLPVCLILFAFASGISAIFFQIKSLTAETAMLYSIVYCLPIFFVGVVVLIKFIIAASLHSRISIAVYAGELYIKNRKRYLIFEREQVVNASIRNDFAQIKEMRFYGRSPFDTDNGTIRLETQDGEFLLPCCNLEKTANALLAFIKNNDDELREYTPSLGNGFLRSLLRIFSIFGLLLCLEAVIIFTIILTGFHIEAVVVADILSISMLIFGISGALYVFIAPQLKNRE